jgi:hypothetical protein
VARGWESKSIESQMESAEMERQRRSRQKIDQNQVDQEYKKRSLLLSRTRVMHDLEKATHERYQQVLREALAHLDREIQKLG